MEKTDGQEEEEGRRRRWRRGLAVVVTVVGGEEAEASHWTSWLAARPAPTARASR